MSKKEYHWGIVQDNNDPEKRGRLVVECPTLVSGDILEWVEPTFYFVDNAENAGCFFVPNIGSQIEVEIESEEDAEVNGLEAKWRCSIYPDGTVPEEFTENYPNRRGWKTSSGHILYFDDSNGNLTFLYKHPSEAEIRVDNSGNIYLKAASGKSVLVGDGADQKLVRGDNLKTVLDAFIAWANAHVHPSNGSPPTVLFPDDSTDNILSTLHKVK